MKMMRNVLIVVILMSASAARLNAFQDVLQRATGGAMKLVAALPDMYTNIEKLKWQITGNPPADQFVKDMIDREISEGKWQAPKKSFKYIFGEFDKQIKAADTQVARSVATMGAAVYVAQFLTDLTIFVRNILFIIATLTPKEKDQIPHDLVKEVDNVKAYISNFQEAFKDFGNKLNAKRKEFEASKVEAQKQAAPMPKEPTLDELMVF